jgi:hypothetical protein
MKVLVVYGGPHNGFKKEFAKQHQGLSSQSKVTTVSNLTVDNQYFINTVNNIVKKQTVAAVDEIEVISRHLTDLKDYIYDPDGIQEGKHLVHDVKQLFQPALEKDMCKDENSAKRFDYLDFVLIDVPGTVLPWQERSKQLTDLFYQCKITNKPVFAAGVGMAQVAYFCSMESRGISIINGLEKGGSIQNIRNFVAPEVLPKIQRGYHCYMDNLSGDIYSYN